MHPNLNFPCYSRSKEKKTNALDKEKKCIFLGQSCNILVKSETESEQKMFLVHVEPTKRIQKMDETGNIHELSFFIEEQKQCIKAMCLTPQTY